MRPVTQSNTRSSSSSKAHLRVLSAPVAMMPAKRTRTQASPAAASIDIGARVINAFRILAPLGIAANLAWMYLL